MMDLSPIYAGLAAAAALLYAAAFLTQPPSLTRTIIKVVSIAALVMVTLLEDGPLLLALGLSLSAVGDAFLAQEGRGPLLSGMVAFAAAHLVYVLMILLAGGGLGPDAGRYLAQAGTLGLAACALAWLRPSLAGMALPVIGYAGIVTLMAVTAIGLPPVLWLASVGAVLFFMSDGILAAQLFRLGRTGRQGAALDVAVWGLYWGGQAMITAAFLDRMG